VTMTPTKAAAALAATAVLYLVGVAATGRSARADVPPDLAAKPSEPALDVWKGAAALVEADGRGLVVDVRPADAYARYHLPGAESMPGASADEVVARAKGRPVTLVYAGKDEVAQKLVADVRRAAGDVRIHVLAGGARAWYLAFALPVPLFSEQPPPDGYVEALAKARAALERPGATPRGEAVEALQTLARVSYQPELLRAGKAKPAGGAKKKIAGGCG
jgi:rhodanese-related sulfurtransferase